MIFIFSCESRDSGTWLQRLQHLCHPQAPECEVHNCSCQRKETNMEPRLSFVSHLLLHHWTVYPWATSVQWCVYFQCHWYWHFYFEAAENIMKYFYISHLYFFSSYHLKEFFLWYDMFWYELFQRGDGPGHGAAAGGVGEGHALGQGHRLLLVPA